MNSHTRGKVKSNIRVIRRPNGHNKVKQHCHNHVNKLTELVKAA